MEDSFESEGGLPQNHYHYHYHYYTPQRHGGRRAKAGRQIGEKPLTDKGRIRRNANVVCGGLLLLVFISFAAYWLAGVLARVVVSANQFVEIRHIIEQAVSIVAYALSFGLALLMIKKWLKIPARVAFPTQLKDFSITLPAIFICLGINTLGGFLHAIIAAMLETGFGVVSSAPELRAPDGGPALLMYIISLTIIPAVLEELVFRGVVMQSLRRFGDGFALVISSILFGFIHGNLIQFIPAFLTGIAIGYFVMRTGSILTGILIHLVNNGTVVLADLLTRGGNEELMMITGSFINVFHLSTGVIAVAFLLWRRPGIFKLAPSRIPLARRKKNIYFFTSLTCIIFTLLSLGIMATFFY